MKERLLSALLLLFSVATAAAIELDVKTHFLDKPEMVGIKYGAIYYLEKRGIGVVEKGEEFCLWIEPLSERKQGAGRVDVRVRLRLTPPTLFREGRTLQEREVTFSYGHEPKVLTTDDSFWKFIKEKVKGIRREEELRAFYGGQAIAREVEGMLAAQRT